MVYAEEDHEIFFKQQKFDNVDDFYSPFEEDVAKERRKRGWYVKTQIAVGGYRVYLRIVHPEHQGMFIAGIECDGAKYHSASSARDRDILRKSVLEGLGWNILRIWSTDWWHNKNHVLDKVEKQLDELILNKKQINQQILHVVNVLGSTSISECFSIIRNCCGFKRIGNKMQEFLESCSKGIYKRKFGDDYFYRRTKNHFDTIDSLRHPTTGNKRHPKTIAPKELIFDFYPIIELNKEVEKQDLFKRYYQKYISERRIYIF